MGSMKGQVRVAYSKSGTAPTTLTGIVGQGGAGVHKSDLEGKYFRVEDRVYALADGRLALKALPQTTDEQWGWLIFDPERGDGEFGWTDPSGHFHNAPYALR
ncbi:MAG: hypothetical protein KF754_03370 [Planctomycetes bacterium]|nr:hypothetical protein [Planctomycetota bacterium]